MADAPSPQTFPPLDAPASVPRSTDGRRETGAAAVLEAVFREAPSFLHVLQGPDFVFEFANDAYYRLVGRRDLIGRPAFAAIPEAAAGGFPERLADVMTTGRPFVGRELPVTLARTPGAPPEERLVDLEYLPLVDADGRITRVLGYGTDVTEHVEARRRNETALQEQQLELELANQQLQENAAELEAQTAALQATAAHLTARTEEAERALAALAASEARFRTVQDASPLGFAVHRPVRAGGVADGPVVDFTTGYVNDAGARLLGHPRAHILAGTLHEVWPATERDSVFADAVRVLQTGAPLSRELSYAHDGRAAGLLITMVRIGAGTETELGVTFLDITARLQAEQERTQLLAQSEAARVAAETARTAANRASVARTNFLATMSHELRTPLNAIGGYTELLALGITGPVTEAQRQQLDRIQHSQQHLLGLINEVLDLSKIDAGAVVIDRAPVAAAGTMDAALTLVRPQAAAKGLVIIEHCDVPEGVRYLGDEPRVRQILVNLLANAVKFTPLGGRVALSCTLGEATADAVQEVAATTVPTAIDSPAFDPPPGPYLMLQVADTGLGIAADQHARIFDPFTQAHTGTNPYTRVVGGTGLGLTISRRLARLMGGDLTVDSAPGSGSTFTLRLPLADRRTQPRTPTPIAGMPAVDDAARTPAASPMPADPAVGRLGMALLEEAGPVVRAWSACLRADPAVPTAHPDGRPLTAAELENHIATFLTDVALTLCTLADGGEGVATLLRDGTAILATVAERHGAQRARLGWPAALMARTLALLGTEIEAAIERVADGSEGAAVTRAREVVRQLIAQGTRVSLGGHRVALSNMAGRA